LAQRRSALRLPHIIVGSIVTATESVTTTKYNGHGVVGLGRTP
jgi:hypothetical protein